MYECMSVCNYSPLLKNTTIPVLGATKRDPTPRNQI